MSTDQYDATQVVRLRLYIKDTELFMADEKVEVRLVSQRVVYGYTPIWEFLAGKKPKWSPPMIRKEAELMIAGWKWIRCPIWEGEFVLTTAIIPYNFN